jgi:hypothetical protein
MELILGHVALAILAAVLVERAKSSYRHFQDTKDHDTKNNDREKSDEA